MPKHAWALDHFFYFDFKKIKILARKGSLLKEKFYNPFIFIKEYKDLCTNLQSERMHINDYYQCILN